MRAPLRLPPASTIRTQCLLAPGKNMVYYGGTSVPGTIPSLPKQRADTGQRETEAEVRVQHWNGLARSTWMTRPRFSLRPSPNAVRAVYGGTEAEGRR